MNAREYLSEIRHIKNELRICRTQAKNCHISYSSLTGIDYSRDIVQSSPRNALEEAAWRMLEQEQGIAKELQELTTDLNHRLQLIKNLDDGRFSDILFKIYYENKNLKRISNESGYKIGYIKNLHADALKAFESKYNLFDL